MLLSLLLAVQELDLSLPAPEPRPAIELTAEPHGSHDQVVTLASNALETERVFLRSLLAGSPPAPARRAPTRRRAPAAAPGSDPAELQPAAGGDTGHELMLAHLAWIAEETPRTNAWIGEAAAWERRTDLCNELELLTGVERFEALFELALLEVQQGRELEALAAFEEARALLPTVRAELRPGLSTEFHYRMGLAWMRRGETENCCARNGPESCILPLRGDALHTAEEGSRKALELFGEVLAEAPGHWRARWLTNLAMMTLDRYPGEVPESAFVPPERFGVGADFPEFENVAGELGLDTFNLFGGVVVDDFDGDGFLDILTSTWDPTGPMHFFRNEGDGTFADRTEDAGLKGLLGGVNLVQADYDNDGDLDVFVLRGAWLRENGRHPNSLLQNDGAGRFTDVTHPAGLGNDAWPSHSAAWADYDLDGFVDLYVGNEHSAGVDAPGQLFHNQGDGTFVDVAREAGVENLRFAKGVDWGDYDGDGDPDLFVSNLQQKNRLYRNEGDGTFVDVAQELGVAGPRDSFPTWFWDFDNDGLLDLYVPSYKGGAGDLAQLAKSYLGGKVTMEKPSLFRGRPGGRFQDVAAKVGLERIHFPMGANYGDLDNDGFLDIYLGTGYPDFEALMPNVVYRSDAGRHFTDVTAASRMGHLQKGHGIAFADFDHDGDQDVFAQMGGAFRGDEFYDAFYENPGSKNDWITLQLVGTRTNRAALGARIRVVVEDESGERSVYRHVDSGGSFGSSPLRQTIGLGQARLKRVEVLWPVTGETQVFEDLAEGCGYRLVEDSDEAEELELKRLQF